MGKPWVSFCMSTFKRPDFLKKQLVSLLHQTNNDFEIVISDNDPDGSGSLVVERLNDPRLKYYKNEGNLGMVKSFNKSIERASTEYIVMVTDDDPVQPEMLAYFKEIIEKYPSYSIYCGCVRANKEPYHIEQISSEDFLFELLHPQHTFNILWSSCILKRETVIRIGNMPDFGSPHLADHAMLALCGSESGGLMINKMFSNLGQHDGNFSKSNLNLYYVGCESFIKQITSSVPEFFYIKNNENALFEHLKHWFIATLFTLKKYYTITKNDKNKLREAEHLARNVLDIPLMKKVKLTYIRKELTFFAKKPFWKLGLLK